jgi:hypothetical protein
MNVVRWIGFGNVNRLWVLRFWNMVSQIGIFDFELEFRLMNTFTKYGVAAATFLSLGLAANASQAAVYIGLSLNGGAISTQVDADPSADSAAFFGSFGTFDLNLVTGSNPGAPTLLDSTTNNASTATAGILDVYITRDNISAPLNLIGYKTSFTTNALPTGWTVRQRSYVNTVNTLYTGGTLVGDVMFNTSNSTAVQFAAPIAIAGPYSVTTRYTIAASGAGSSLSTMTLAAVPEPGTWALMIMGFGGAGAMLRSRRRSAVTA